MMMMIKFHGVGESIIYCLAINDGYYVPARISDLFISDFDYEIYAESINMNLETVPSRIKHIIKTDNKMIYEVTANDIWLGQITTCASSNSCFIGLGMDILKFQDIYVGQQVLTAIDTYHVANATITDIKPVGVQLTYAIELYIDIEDGICFPVIDGFIIPPSIIA